MGWRVGTNRKRLRRRQVSGQSHARWEGEGKQSGGHRHRRKLFGNHGGGKDETGYCL